LLAAERDEVPVVEQYGLALGAEVILLHVLPTGGLACLARGGVAATVVREATCPVLLVRPDEAISTALPVIRSCAENVARDPTHTAHTRHA
jgi:hypothetical protein